MNNKTLAILAILALGLLAAAVFTQKPAGGQQLSQEDSFLFPGLVDKIESASRLEMYQAGSDEPVLSFSKQGDQWLVDAIGYPMNFDMIRTLLRTLSEAKLSEKMTANPEYHHRLGLREVSDPGSLARLIRISDQQGNSLGGVVMGKTVARGGNSSTYVRREGENQSWLIAGVVQMSPKPEKWLSLQIADIPVTEIKSAEVIASNGERLYVHKQDPEQIVFTIDQLPENAELIYPGIASTAAEALSDFDLMNVQHANNFSFTDGAIVRSHYTLFNGMAVSVRSERRGPEYFAQFAVEYSGDDPEVKAQAAALEARVDGWVYQIPPHKFKMLSKQMVDLLAESDMGPEAPAAE